MKVIIFSHESDIDGIGCVVLAKLAFNNLDYVLAPNIEKLELIFREYIESNKLNEYDKIFVTDLSLYDPALSMVANSNLSTKVQVFDHHKRSILDGMNRYSFTTVIEEDEKGKRCGTELFYEYLVNNNFLCNKPCIEQFVEMTRLEDTWEWKKKGSFGIAAHDLSILFNVIGIEKYIDRMVMKLNNSIDFNYNDEETLIINNKKKEYEIILNKYLQETEYFVDDNNDSYGIVYADYEYRNEIAEYIKNHNVNNLKYFIIVAMNKGEYGQKSYRTIVSGFDVNKIAMLHGGGGHPAAACVNIRKEQRDKALTLSKKDGLKYLADCSY